MIIFNAKEHLKLGLLYTIPFYLPKFDNTFEFFSGVIIGSLLPDIDHENSIAGSIIPLWKIFKHGRQTHTIIALLLIVIAYILLKKDWLFGLAIGYGSHLIADELSGNNLKYLFFPLKRGFKLRK